MKTILRRLLIITAILVSVCGMFVPAHTVYFLDWYIIPNLLDKISPTEKICCNLTPDPIFRHRHLFVLNTRGSLLSVSLLCSFLILQVSFSAETFQRYR